MISGGRLHFGFSVIGLSASVFLAFGCHDTRSAAVASAPSESKPASTAVTPSKVESQSLAAGTPIPVETIELFDTDASAFVKFMIGKVAEDVKGPDGGVAVPANTHALIVLRAAGRQGTHSMATLGLNRLEIGGKAYKVGDGSRDMATLEFDEDSTKGPGHRTVHIERASILTFRLAVPVQLR